jgi:hypothetical protein
MHKSAQTKDGRCCASDAEICAIAGEKYGNILANLGLNGTFTKRNALLLLLEKGGFKDG